MAEIEVALQQKWKQKWKQKWQKKEEGEGEGEGEVALKKKITVSFCPQNKNKKKKTLKEK